MQDLPKQAVSLLNDLQKVMQTIDADRRSRDNFNQQERVNWAREREELKKNLQDRNKQNTELRQEVDRQSQQAQNTNQALDELQQKLQQAEEEAKEHAGRARTAIQAAEFMQNELNSMKNNLQQALGQQHLQGNANQMGFDGSTVPRFLQPGPTHGVNSGVNHGTESGANGSNNMRGLPPWHNSNSMPGQGMMPQQQQQQQQHGQNNQHQQPGLNNQQQIQSQNQFQPQQQYNMSGGGIMGSSGGVPLDPRRQPAGISGPMNMMSNNAGPPPQHDLKRKQDATSMGGPPPKQMAYGGGNMQGPGFHAQPPQYPPGGQPPMGMGGPPKGDPPAHAGMHARPPPQQGNYVSSGAMQDTGNFGMRPQMGTDAKILLSNLPFALTLSELRDLAGTSRNGLGAVMHAELEYIPDGRPKGTAVITYADARAAEHAVQDLNRRAVGGRQISAALDRRQ